MGAGYRGTATYVSLRVLQLAQAQLTAVRQERVEDLECLMAERQEAMESLSQLSLAEGERQAVVASLRQAQSIDREIEAHLSSVLQETRREIEGIQVGRRLLQRYGEDQHHPMASLLDVHS